MFLKYYINSAYPVVIANTNNTTTNGINGEDRSNRIIDNINNSGGNGNVLQRVDNYHISNNSNSNGKSNIR